MDENVYKTPQSVLAVEPTDSVNLASRWERLGASIIDAITIMLVTLPVMYFTGGFEGITEGVQPSWGYTFIISLIGTIVFFAINGNLLVKSGQTLGKKLLGIQMVDLNNSLPTTKVHLIKRYAVYFLPGQIPVVGQFISLINIVFIFGKEKRCIHDYVAGTKVIKI